MEAMAILVGRWNREDKMFIIGGKCAGFRAKRVHISDHLPLASLSCLPPKHSNIYAFVKSRRIAALVGVPSVCASSKGQHIQFCSLYANLTQARHSGQSRLFF